MVLDFAKAHLPGAGGTMFKLASSVIALAAAAAAHGNHDNQEPISGPHKSLWYNTLPGDGGTQVRRSLTVILGRSAS